MLLTCAQMKRVEEAAFARGVEAEVLMDAAGAAIARTVLDFLPSPAHAVVFCGKGNNAGDVLVAARHLAALGWSFELDLAFPETDFSPLAAKKFAELTAVPKSKIQTAAGRSRGEGDNLKSKIALDGLLGIGAAGAPREPVASAIRRIHALRENRGAFVVAADLPSGLDGDTGAAADPCVIADLTVTIGQPKTGLVADAATNFVGRLALAPLPELATDEGDPAELLTPELLRLLHKPPPFDSHKGLWGRVGILAGSRGFLGAAHICAEAALRTGGGLVTLYALPDAYELLATVAPPEVMVKPVRDHREALKDRFDAIGIGPGLGRESDDAILEVVTRFPGPMVVDADALNALSRRGLPAAFAGPRLLTPHPGEMARLFPESAHLPRRAAAEQFVAQHGVTLLLKGARTIIAEAGAPTVFNTTGNPGMGSGGMGDALTGVCAALLAQKHPPREAAMLGAWLCGRAAERFVFGPNGSPESLVASEVIRHLGGAFRDLQR
jgi:NAD(P)H-hydrate epimerase